MGTTERSGLFKSGNTIDWGPHREVFYRDILDSMADGV
jgi:hypothetical protein